MTHPFEEFRAKRKAGNEKALETDNLLTKRFFSLDKQAYGDGALDAKTKELLGLAASMVLRCNDCIDYHLEGAVKAGYNKSEIDEAMGVALLVGGSIVIPHLRHAAQSLEFLFQENEKNSD
ncbi:carboxymuconolactone decarboxylase family protein [Pleionea sediminis]|uniref:carboxymuconolactone decarboxylase family protein n=1 Tax=Pleionea sediminis TaxID=2569479 RepID=UPI001186C30E|nr:carboxymuconolactone decarboxylase family protein [Pleionea sediminis]